MLDCQQMVAKANAPLRQHRMITKDGAAAENGQTFGCRRLSAPKRHGAARRCLTPLETKQDAPHSAGMETFCITIDDGRGPQRYDMELPSVCAAREELTRIFGDMISNGVADFWAARDWRISVSKAGMPLFVLHASALELSGPLEV